MIGDGDGIPITHVGSTIIEAPTTTFLLDNVLCAPLIKKNLLSVSQFCHQNNTSIEFFPDFFTVKDLSTGASLCRLSILSSSHMSFIAIPWWPINTRVTYLF